MVILSGLGSGQPSRPVKKARKARKANPGLLDTWLLGPLLGLRFRLWTLAHTLGWTTISRGWLGQLNLVLSCLKSQETCMQSQTSCEVTFLLLIQLNHFPQSPKVHKMQAAALAVDGVRQANARAIPRPTACLEP